jgi:hypothetical protein
MRSMLVVAKTARYLPATDLRQESLASDEVVRMVAANKKYSHFFAYFICAFARFGYNARPFTGA